MTFSTFTSWTALVVGILALLLTLLYRAALPKPIPGIPYNHASARSIFGDIPGMMKWKAETRETFTWMTEQCKLLNAPMVQLFVKPFSLPWVIVTDARECLDVLTRRSKEFDRSSFTTDVVLPILREHHFPFPSGPKQRAHRALLSDLMTPAFLNEVCRIYIKTQSRTHKTTGCRSPAIPCDIGVTAALAEKSRACRRPPVCSPRRHRKYSSGYDLGSFYWRRSADYKCSDRSHREVFRHRTSFEARPPRNVSQSTRPLRY
jgi:hypothetical protein